MARKVNGTASILAATRVICRMVGKYGTVRLAASTTPEFAAAVGALVLACQVFEAVDDYVAVTDRTPGGSGEGDEDIAIGGGTLAKEALQ